MALAPLCNNHNSSRSVCTIATPEASSGRTDLTTATCRTQKRIQASFQIAEIEAHQCSNRLTSCSPGTVSTISTTFPCSFYWTAFKAWFLISAHPRNFCTSSKRLSVRAKDHPTYQDTKEPKNKPRAKTTSEGSNNRCYGECWRARDLRFGKRSQRPPYHLGHLRRRTQILQVTQGKTVTNTQLGPRLAPDRQTPPLNSSLNSFPARRRWVSMPKSSCT